jgi:hypothetical protein
MPDPNAPDAEVNKPNLPLDFHFSVITDSEINCGWMWAIDRVGRIPKGTHMYCIEYDQVKHYQGKEGLEQLFEILDDHDPSFGPQPAFKVTHLSKIPMFGVDIVHQTLSPDTEYFLAFASFNDAGRSRYFGTFDYQQGQISSVRTKEASSG